MTGSPKGADRLRGVRALLRLREAELLRAEARASMAEQRRAVLEADVRALVERRQRASLGDGDLLERLRLTARLGERKVECVRELARARCLLDERAREAGQARGRRDAVRELCDRELSGLEVAEERRRETAAGDAAAARRRAAERELW